MSEDREWTFLSNHGHVLVCLALDPDSRMRDVAHHVGITERAAQMIVRDLVDAGYIRKTRAGRRNSYTVVDRQRFRHPLEAHVAVGDFLDLVTAPRVPTRRPRAGTTVGRREAVG